VSTQLNLICDWDGSDYDLDKALRERFGKDWGDNWIVVDYELVRIDHERYKALVEAELVEVLR